MATYLSPLSQSVPPYRAGRKKQCAIHLEAPWGERVKKVRKRQARSLLGTDGCLQGTVKVKMAATMVWVKCGPFHLLSTVLTTPYREEKHPANLKSPWVMPSHVWLSKVDRLRYQHGMFGVWWMEQPLDELGVRRSQLPSRTIWPVTWKPSRGVNGSSEPQQQSASRTTNRYSVSYAEKSSR